MFTWFAPAIFAPRFIDMGSWSLGLGSLALMWALATLYYALIPDVAFAGSRLEPVISHRATAISRVTFVTLVYGTLTYIDLSLGAVRAWRVFEVYWALPLFTTFPLFMVMRHWVHHGNADRGRYTNTRVYLVNPIVRYAIFPLGFEYHLPHHIYASVPHFRLKKLHELLQNDPEYREKCVVVEGYFGHGNPEEGRPSALGVLGEKYAPKGTEKAFLDGSVLEPVGVADRAGIERAVEESARAASA
jgi:fatty acid desaturase